MLAALALAATAAPALAQAPAQQQPQLSWEMATRQALQPQWSFRQNETWYSFRNPLTNFYATVGGHAGISTDTTLRNTAGCPAGEIVLGCSPFAPSGDLGTGGGGSFGVGARITPMFRTALIFTAEGGYRQDSFFQPTETLSLAMTARVRSFQTAANLYADLGGVLGTGRWNPYIMGGLGVAVNMTNDVNATLTFDTGDSILRQQEAIPNSGRTSTNFLWTAGAGVQYQLTPSSTIEVYYQYVDAGKFRVGSSESLGTLEGNLRTHRLGAAVSINFSFLAQLVGGR